MVTLLQSNISHQLAALQMRGGISNLLIFLRALALGALGGLDLADLMMLTALALTVSWSDSNMLHKRIPGLAKSQWAVN